MPVIAFYIFLMLKSCFDKEPNNFAGAVMQRNCGFTVPAWMAPAPTAPALILMFSS
jgi:hypothetical protein